MTKDELFKNDINDSITIHTLILLLMSLAEIVLLNNNI